MFDFVMGAELRSRTYCSQRVSTTRSTCSSVMFPSLLLVPATVVNKVPFFSLI